MKQTIEEPILDNKLINWSYQTCYDYFLLRKTQEKENPLIINNHEEDIVLEVPYQSETVTVKYSSLYTETEYLKQNDLWFNADLSSFWNSSASVTEARTGKLPKLPRIREEDYECNEPEDSSYIASPEGKYLQNIINLKQSYDNEELIIVKNPQCVNKVFRIGCSGIIGIGTGLATMPIINENIWNLENFDIHVHEENVFFIISTINTLLVVTAYSGLHMYKYLKPKNELNNIINDISYSELEDNITACSKLKKIACQGLKLLTITASLQSVLMLWDIELKNENIDEDTNGFNDFTAWATFTTLPLLTYKAIENYRHFSKTIDSEQTKYIELDSIGAKVFTYSIVAISTIGRGVALTAVYKSIFKEIGIEDRDATISAVILGGVAANGIQGMLEYGNVQALFDKNIHNLNFKSVLKGIFSAIEGAWFALPIVAVGLSAVESLNSLLKMLVFLPTFLSRMSFEASNIHDSFDMSFTENGALSYVVNNQVEDTTQSLMGEENDSNILN